MENQGKILVLSVLYVPTLLNSGPTRNEWMPFPERGYTQVDLLGSRYKLVNFGAEKRPCCTRGRGGGRRLTSRAPQMWEGT